MQQAAEFVAGMATRHEVPPTSPVELYIWAGDKKSALDWLERAYEARDPNFPYLRYSPNDPLRAEPRFQALLRRMGLPQ